jgi:hypothetical protein
MTPLLALSLLGAAPVTPGSCDLLHPVASDEAAARRIAEAVIRNVNAFRAPRVVADARRALVLTIIPDWDDAGQWIAVEMLRPPPPPRRPNDIVLQAGGGGLGFRIDRCTGAISRMSFQR